MSSKVVSLDEAHLRGLVDMINLLSDALINFQNEGSHLNLVEAISYTRLTVPELQGSLNDLSHSVKKGLELSLSKISGKTKCEIKDLNDIIGDCYEMIDRSIDNFKGNNLTINMGVQSVKKWKVGPIEAVNIIKQVDRSIYSRNVHPFESVIQNLSFSSGFYRKQFCPIEFYTDSVEKIPFKYIDTEQSLIEMINDLKDELVIAIDLENHNYYSYFGFTCLIQISSIKSDFIIDAIKLKSCLKHHLPIILSDPKILKLLHGAEHDSGWLQRDFDCFLVSVFDSFIAAKHLNLVKKGLSGLLEYYFSIQLDKQYQLADWRIRPLTEEMLRYARLDTHYLLPLWDKLKADLIAIGGESGLTSTYKNSSHQCLQLFKTNVSSNTEEKIWKSLIDKSSAILDESQKELVRVIFFWRDSIARKEDVCLHAVLANHWIVRLSMSKPTSVDAIKRALRDGLTVILERNIESLNYIIRNTIINDFSKSDGPNSVNKHNSQRLLKRPITINKSDPAESNNSFWSPTSFQKSEPQIIYAPSKIPETSEMISDKYKPIISFKKEEIDIEVSIQNTKKIYDIDQLSSNSFLESAIHKSNARKLQSLNNESIQEFDYISAKSKVYCSIPDSFGKSLRLMNEDRSFKNSSRKKAKRITSGKYTVFPKHESK